MKIVGEMAGQNLLVSATPDELAQLAGYASKWDLERKTGKRGQLKPGMTIEISENWRLLQLVHDYKERGSFHELAKICRKTLAQLDKLDSMEFFGFTVEEEDDA